MDGLTLLYGARAETSAARMLSVEWLPTVGRRTAMAIDTTFFDTRIEDLFHNRQADDSATDAGYGWQRADFGHAEPDFGSMRMFRTPERYGSASVQWPLQRGVTLFAAE